MRSSPRIAELERLLEEIRRGVKRQSAPFSKNLPKDEWQKRRKRSWALNSGVVAGPTVRSR